MTHRRRIATSLLSAFILLTAPLSAEESCKDVEVNFERVKEWYGEENLPAGKIAVCQGIKALKGAEEDLAAFAGQIAKAAAMEALKSMPFGGIVAGLSGDDAPPPGISEADFERIDKIMRTVIADNERDNFDTEIGILGDQLRDYFSSRSGSDQFDVASLNDIINSYLRLKNNVQILGTNDFKMAKVYLYIASQGLIAYRDKDLITGGQNLKVAANDMLKKASLMFQNFENDFQNRFKPASPGSDGSSDPINGRSCRINKGVESSFSGKYYPVVSRSGVDNCELTPQEWTLYRRVRSEAQLAEFPEALDFYFGPDFFSTLKYWADIAGLSSYPKIINKDQIKSLSWQSQFKSPESNTIWAGNGWARCRLPYVEQIGNVGILPTNAMHFLRLRDDGVCKNEIGKGLFTVPGSQTIYSSNGTDAFCGLAAGYPTGSSPIEDYNWNVIAHTSLRNDGNCRDSISSGIFQSPSGDFFSSNGISAFCRIPHSSLVGSNPVTMYSYDILNYTSLRNDGNCMYPIPHRFFKVAGEAAIYSSNARNAYCQVRTMNQVTGTVHTYPYDIGKFTNYRYDGTCR